MSLLSHQYIHLHAHFIGKKRTQLYYNNNKIKRLYYVHIFNKRIQSLPRVGDQELNNNNYVHIAIGAIPSFVFISGKNEPSWDKNNNGKSTRNPFISSSFSFPFFGSFLLRHCRLEYSFRSSKLSTLSEGKHLNTSS